VRETLAHSLHEVGRLVGQHVAERTLLTVFEAFVQDLDEVKSGVVAHLAAFLAVLSPSVRAQYAHVLSELRQEGSWRLREALASQMAQFAALFEPGELAALVTPCCAALCRDPVLSVRAAAAPGLAALLARAGRDGDAQALAALHDELARLRQGGFHDRALLARVCGFCLSAAPVEAQHAQLLHELEQLAHDRTPNVRLAAAEALVRQTDETMRAGTGWKALCNDADFDVRFAATGVYVPFSQRKSSKLT